MKMIGRGKFQFEEFQADFFNNVIDSKSPKEIAKLVDEAHCDDDSDAPKLTDWEIDFIETIISQKQETVSPNQFKILCRLYDEKTP